MNDRFSFGNVSGPVNAGSGNLNVGSGSQTVAGGDVAIGSTIGSDPEIAGAISKPRQSLEEMRLSGAERRSAEENLDALERAGTKEEAAGHLESLVSGVKNAGALASAGLGFVDSVTKIAAVLGPVAMTVMHFL